MGLTGTPVLVLRMGDPADLADRVRNKMREVGGASPPHSILQRSGKGAQGQTPCSAHTHPYSLAQCVVQEENVTEPLLSGPEGTWAGPPRGRLSHLRPEALPHCSRPKG